MERAYQCGGEREGVGFLIYFSSSFITRKYLSIYICACVFIYRYICSFLYVVARWALI